MWTHSWTRAQTGRWKVNCPSPRNVTTVIFEAVTVYFQIYPTGFKLSFSGKIILPFSLPRISDYWSDTRFILCSSFWLLIHTKSFKNSYFPTNLSLFNVRKLVVGLLLYPFIFAHIYSFKSRFISLLFKEIIILCNTNLMVQHTLQSFRCQITQHHYKKHANNLCH